MWPGFDSLTRRHMWDEFVVGSLLAPRGFSLVTLVFPFPQKPTFQNSDLESESNRFVSRTTVSATLIKKVDLV